MKVAAIVVAYNPNKEELLNNIKQYIDVVDKLFIWQNSKFEVSVPDAWLSKIEWMGDGVNKFMSEPLNMALDRCTKLGFDYLLTMDQDSTWENFNDFLEEVQRVRIENAVIYTPNINNQFDRSVAPQEVEGCITSGSLCDVKRSKELGGFREDYKIYWVDGEFCYWARKNNYKIIRLGQYNMTQKFGTPVKNIFNIYVANYSPIVYYFMFRNMLWMKREFGKNAVSLKTVLYTGFLYTRSVLLCESSKTKKMWKISNGFYDGIFGKFQKRKIAQ